MSETTNKQEELNETQAPAQEKEAVKQPSKIKILAVDFQDHPSFTDQFNLKENSVFTDKEDKKAFWQVLDQIDNAIKTDNAKNEPKLSKDRIVIEISDDKETIPLQIKFGENYFEQNDLNKLITMCSNDLSKKELSKETKQEFSEALEKVKEPENKQEKTQENSIGQSTEQVGNKKSIYAHPAEKDRVNDIIGGSLEASQSLGQTSGDEAMKIFMQNMNGVYRNLSTIGKNKSQEQGQQAQEQNAPSAGKSLSDTLVDAAKDTAVKTVGEAMSQTFTSFAKDIAGKLSNKIWSKDKDKEISNTKEMGLSR